MNITHNLANILTELMKAAQIDDGELSKRTGIPHTSISRMRRDKHSNPTVSSLRPIACFFGVSISELLGDIPLENGIIPGYIDPLQSKSAYLPILTFDLISDWLKHYNSVQPNEWVATEKILSGKSFAAKIESNHLGPLFQFNSIIIVEPKKEISESDYILVMPQSSDHLITIKQIVKDGNDIYIKPVNPDFRNTQLLLSDVCVLGVVVEVRLEPNPDSFRTSPSKRPKIVKSSHLKKLGLVSKAGH